MAEKAGEILQRWGISRGQLTKKGDDNFTCKVNLSREGRALEFQFVAGILDSIYHIPLRNWVGIFESQLAAAIGRTDGFRKELRLSVFPNFDAPHPRYTLEIVMFEEGDYGAILSYSLKDSDIDRTWDLILATIAPIWYVFKEPCALFVDTKLAFDSIKMFRERSGYAIFSCLTTGEDGVIVRAQDEHMNRRYMHMLENTGWLDSCTIYSKPPKDLFGEQS